MSAKDSFDVVIGGGGFAGLALAIALARSDSTIRVALVDRATPRAAIAAADDGRATALTAGSRRLLEAIGVWSAVSAKVQPINDIEITDSALTNIVRPRLLHFDGELHRGEPAAFMIENAVLRAGLVETAQALSGIAIMAPESVAAFTAGGTGMQIELAGGGALGCSLLVASDGRRSTLRRQAGIRTTGWSYPQVGLVATIAHQLPHEGLAIQHFLPAGPFAILPLTGNRSSIVWTEEEHEGRRIAALDDDAFIAAMEPRFGARFGPVSLAGPRGLFPLALHLARAFTADRFALIGDAAHGVHPLAGQGLNIGLRDVAALTESIIGARGIGLEAGAPQALQRYERWRRFDSAFSGLAMDALNRLFSNDNAPLRAVRSLGLGAVDRAPALKRFFVAEAAGMTGELPVLLTGELP